MRDDVGTKLLSLTRQCVHCGFCLPVCPTYGIFGTEMDGARGRIALSGAMAEGRVPLTDPYLGLHLSRCLDCRACEAACPSEVRYGEIIEAARTGIESRRRRGLFERIVRKVALEMLIPHRGRLRAVAVLLWLYESSGVQWLVRRLPLLPRRLRDMEGLLPPIDLSWGRGAEPANPSRRVAFFAGCVQDALLSGVNLATVRVLERNGCRVLVPAGQTCCGAVHMHLGEVELAREMARRNVRAFISGEVGDVEAIVVNAGGCGAHLKSYDRLLADDPEYAAPARRFAGLVVDVGEFLAASPGRPPEGRLDLRVTYADSCHLRHAQGVVDAPRGLIRAIPGVEYRELEDAGRCCGSAGVYNITHPEIADRLLEAKVDDIARTGADVAVVTNTGCHLQIAAGLRRAGHPARVLHLVELMEMSYREEERSISR